MKLKNYEIEALVNVICAKVVEKKTQKVKELLARMKKSNLAKLTEYEEAVQEIFALGDKILKMEEEFQQAASNDGVCFAGMDVNAIKHEFHRKKDRGFFKHGESSYGIREEIKNEVIIGNMEGDVSKKIDEIVAKFA